MLFYSYFKTLVGKEVRARPPGQPPVHPRLRWLHLAQRAACPLWLRPPRCALGLPDLEPPPAAAGHCGAEE